jgi:F-type H+-transporting ATPase subunit a
MIFHQLEHLIHVPWVIQATVFAAFLLIVGGLVARRRLAGAQGGIVPDEGITLRNVFEVLVEWLAGLARDRMGPDWRKYFPLVGTIFFFILVSNLLGLIPGFDGATNNINTTLAWAIIAWVFYTAIGFRTHGVSNYMTKFLGPSFFEKRIAGRVVHFRLLAPLFFILEVPLDIARIATLAIRLFANIMAGHQVIWVALMLAPLGAPALFFGLEFIVSFLQAFIFSLLTMVYIGLALDEPH